MTVLDAKQLSQKLEDLNKRAKEANLRGAWNRERPAREGDVEPWAWRWGDIESCLLEAGNLVPIDDVMRMRTIGLVNPTQQGMVGTTRTFGVTIQHLGPGETTEAHRHTPVSIYFMIRGGSTFTTVEGEQQHMEAGDLLVQPTWTWHDSLNAGDDPAIWLTSMDTSLNDYLGTWFREKYPEGDAQPVTKSDGYHMNRLGMFQTSAVLESDRSFPVKYPWKDSLAMLRELAEAGEGDPHDGVVLDYRNPLTGGPTTLTVGCRMQMLRPGQETQSHRHTSNTVYHVVQGEGVALIGKTKGDEQPLTWTERDCFYLPPWHWHRFRNDSSEPAILFSVSDAPLLEGINLYREAKV